MMIKLSAGFAVVAGVAIAVTMSRPHEEESIELTSTKPTCSEPSMGEKISEIKDRLYYNTAAALHNVPIDMATSNNGGNPYAPMRYAYRDAPVYGCVTEVKTKLDLH